MTIVTSGPRAAGTGRHRQSQHNSPVALAVPPRVGQARRVTEILLQERNDAVRAQCAGVDVVAGVRQFPAGPQSGACRGVGTQTTPATADVTPCHVHTCRADLATADLLELMEVTEYLASSPPALERR